MLYITVTKIRTRRGKLFGIWDKSNQIIDWRKSSKAMAIIQYKFVFISNQCRKGWSFQPLKNDMLTEVVLKFWKYASYNSYEKTVPNKIRCLNLY